MARRCDARLRRLIHSDSYRPPFRGAPWEAKMRTLFSALAATVLLCSGSYAAIHAQSQSHVVQTLGQAKWGPAPPLLPAGAQIAVLAGDPTKAVPYTIRLKFPANYAIPAHSHPTDEHIV